MRGTCIFTKGAKACKPARNRSSVTRAVAKAPAVQQFRRQAVKAEEWLVEQQLFQGVDEAVISRLAQCCQSEDVLTGQTVQSSGQKVQDLFILRQGRVQQQGQPSEQGEGNLCWPV